MEYSARLSRSRLSTWSQSSHQILWMAVQSLQIFRHRSSGSSTQFSALLRINHCFEFEQLRRPPPSHNVIKESFLKWKPVQFCHLWRGLNKHPLLYFLLVSFPFCQLLWQVHIWFKLCHVSPIVSYIQRVRSICVRCSPSWRAWSGPTSAFVQIMDQVPASGSSCARWFSFGRFGGGEISSLASDQVRPSNAISLTRSSGCLFNKFDNSNSSMIMMIVSSRPTSDLISNNVYHNSWLSRARKVSKCSATSYNLDTTSVPGLYCHDNDDDLL